MAIDPLSGSPSGDPTHESGANSAAAANATPGPQARSPFSGPPGLPASRGQRDLSPSVAPDGPQTETHQRSLSAMMKLGILRTALEVVDGFCDIQALRADGYPLAHSMEELAGELMSEDVEHVVIAGAFAGSSGPALAEGSIYILGQQLQHYGKRVTYCAPSGAVDHIALENLLTSGFQTAWQSEYHGVDVKRTPDGPSADSEVLARLRGELSPSDLILSIEDKQR